MCTVTISKVDFTLVNQGKRVNPKIIEEKVYEYGNLNDAIIDLKGNGYHEINYLKFYWLPTSYANDENINYMARIDNITENDIR